MSVRQISLDPAIEFESCFYSNSKLRPFSGSSFSTRFILKVHSQPSSGANMRSSFFVLIAVISIVWSSESTDTYAQASLEAKYEVLGQYPDTKAFSVSGDGSVIVGASGFGNDTGATLTGFPFIWTEEKGLSAIPLPTGFTNGVARGVSSDGKTVSGTMVRINNNFIEAISGFIYSVEEGRSSELSIAGLEPYNRVFVEKTNGIFTIGRVSTLNNADGVLPVIWFGSSPTIFEDTTNLVLEELSQDGKYYVGNERAPNAGFLYSRHVGRKNLDFLPLDVTADGSKVVGWQSGGIMQKPVIWTETTGSQVMNCSGTARAVSASGDFTVGSCDGSGVIWLEDGTMRPIYEYVEDEYGLTPIDSYFPISISADGSTIIGIGFNNNKEEAFRLTLPRVTSDFYHKIDNIPAFEEPRLLGSSNPSIVKICADGSQSTLMVVNSTSTDLAERLRLRIVEDPNESNQDLYGIFQEVDGEIGEKHFEYTHPKYVPDGELITEITLQVFDSQSDKVVEEVELEIYRPPVIMVHGLWSSYATFNKMNDAIRGKLWPMDVPSSALNWQVDYSSSSAAYYADNVSVIPNAVGSVLTNARSYGFSVGKVDLVAHSMGGILARKYIQSDTYPNTLNRLITIETPHSGSQLANFLLDEVIKKLNPFLHNVVERVRDINSGAISDLRVDSRATRILNDFQIRNQVYVHAITTSSNPDDEYFLDLIALTPYAETTLEYSSAQAFLDDMFNQEPSDLIVARSSQQAGTFAFSHFEGVSHVSSVNNDGVIDKVISLLGGKPDNFSLDYFSPPELIYNLSPPALSNDNAGKITVANDIVSIQSPESAATLIAGNSVSVEIEGGAEVNQLMLAITNSTDVLHSSLYDGNTTIVNVDIPQNVVGNWTIMAIGFGGEEFGIDTLSVTIETDSPLTKIDPLYEEVVLTMSDTVSIPLIGTYVDGIQRELQGAEYTLTSTEENIVKIIEDQVSGINEGRSVVNIESGSINASIFVTVIGENDFDSSESTTGTENESISTALSTFSLKQNYPNPFQRQTKIPVSIPKPGNFKLSIFNLLGQQVTVLFDGQIRLPGNYEFEFEASNLSSGTYFYRIESDHFLATKAMIVVK